MDMPAVGEMIAPRTDSSRVGPSARGGDPLALQRLRLWARMQRVFRLNEAHLRAFLRVNHDTTLPRYELMAALRKQGAPLSMGELSRMLLVSNGNATAVVERLAREGLVKRLPLRGDRRAVRVALTEEGARRIDAMNKGYAEQVDALFADLGPREIRALRALLDPGDGQ